MGAFSGWGRVRHVLRTLGRFLRAKVVREPSIVTMISLPDLGHEKPSLEALVGLAKQFNRSAGIELLARFNFYLSSAQLDGTQKARRQLQRALTPRVLSPARLNEIVRTFKKRGLYDRWVLLHRAQLLVAIKLLALYGQDEGGNRLQTDAERAQVGELALAINSCYGPGLGEPDPSAGTAIAQMAAGAELYQLSPVAYSLVRTRTLLGPLLRDYLMGLEPKSLPPPFERIFTLLNGINFRDFLDITLYLVIEQRPMLAEVLAVDALTYLDVAQPKRYVSGRSMRAWADLISVSYESIKGLVQDSERDAAFFFDLTMFRQFPLWQVDAHRYFCIDAAFLRERLTSFGFYWVVVNGLGDDALRARFQEVWGELIQEYVRRLLARLFPDSASVVKPTYADDDTEVFDSAVIVNDGVVAIEVKSSVVPIHQKYAGAPGPFFGGLSRKFGSGPSAAVEQLLRNIGSLFAATAPRVAPSIPAASIREIFPMAVVHEPILRFAPAADVVVRDFASGLSGLVLRPDLRVHPVQVVDVEELERLEPHLQSKDFDLLECLRAKIEEDPDHRMGLWQFVSTRYLPARGLTPKPNTRMLATFDWLLRAASWRVYRGDYYDPVLANRGQPSGRALICAKPVAGDELLLDEVVVFSEHANVSEAYRAIKRLQEDDYPSPMISATGFLCGVVDDFGFMLDEPPA